MKVANIWSAGVVLSLAITIAVVASGCDSGGDSSPGLAAGPALQSEPRGQAPGSSPFKSCHSDDPNQLCLSLKYVVYKDGNGVPYADAQLAEKDIEFVNNDWKQCGIAFQIDEYDAVSPADYKLDPGAGAVNELDQIRDAFVDNSRLVLITTGSWGSGATAGWTAMPGQGAGPYGAIVEASISTYPEIMAHELGHYLGLDHVSDQTDLMDPVIYPTSTVLSSSQCATARSAAQSYWSAMLR